MARDYGTAADCIEVAAATESADFFDVYKQSFHGVMVSADGTLEYVTPEGRTRSRTVTAGFWPLSGKQVLAGTDVAVTVFFDKAIAADGV